MDDRLINPVLPSARWASRIAVFVACLLLASILLHRFGGLTTPVALNVFGVTLAGAALAFLLGLFALVRIWLRGDAGALAAATALAIASMILAWPVAYYALHMRLPEISDVTTDTASPPRYAALAKRAAGMNSADYAGERVSQAQLKAYPDLRTFIIDRSVEDAFEFVEEAVRKVRWKVTTAEPPTSRPAKAGIIEATEQTLIIGFWDDIVIRVEGSVNRARVDVRSSSRYGHFDFGQNAARIRRFLTELQARVDAAGPGGVRRLRTTRSGAMVKKGKLEDPQKGAPQSERDRAQPGAPRARAPKETPR